jgi:hypothetical protein
VLSPSQIRFLAPDAVVVADSKRAEEICRKLEFVTDRGIALIRLDHPTGIPQSKKDEESTAVLAGLENRQIVVNERH